MNEKGNRAFKKKKKLHHEIQNELVHFENVLNNCGGTLVSSNTLLSLGRAEWPWGRACAVPDIFKQLLRVFEQEGGHVG